MRITTTVAALGGLFIFTCGTASAQLVDKGIKAGITFSMLPNAGEVVDRVVDPTGRMISVDTSSKVGVAFGGFVRFRINDRAGFAPELLFVMKGVKLDEANNSGTVSVRLNYLEFPLLFRYAVTEADSPRGTPYVFAGPTFGVKVSTSGRLEGGGQSRDITVDPAIRSGDIGIALGGGLENSRFLGELRVTFGLKDIATDLYPHADSLKNRVILILAGVRF